LEPAATLASTAVTVPISTPGPTPTSTPQSAPTATLATTLVVVPEPMPGPVPSPVYVVRDAAGVVVDLAPQPVVAMHPETHALDLLHFLIRDSDFSAQIVTEKALKKYYLTVCRMDRVKPFPWLSVLRQLNRVLRGFYGPAFKKMKTYKNGYDRHGRLRKQRVYRIPTLEEAKQRSDPAQTATRVA
jgi:hypothetical protein